MGHHRRTAPRQTAQPMLIGYGFAVAIGVALALMFAISRFAEFIVYPQILFLKQIIPKIAIAPLLMIWFGYGLTSKAPIVFLLSFFPSATVSAYRPSARFPPRHHRSFPHYWRDPVAHCSGKSKFRTHRRHSIPSSRWRPRCALARRYDEFIVGPRSWISFWLTIEPLLYARCFAAILVLSIMGLLLYTSVIFWNGFRFPGTFRNASTPAWQPPLETRQTYKTQEETNAIKRIDFRTAGQLTSSQRRSGDGQGHVRLNWLLYGFHTPFYLGLERGYYKDEGIDLTIGEGQGSVRAVQTVGAKGDMFGLADGGSLIAGVSKGAPVKAVMAITSSSPYSLACARFLASRP